MTDGEKMIYAQALVTEWNSRMHECEKIRELTTDDVIDQMSSSAEHAHYVVEYFRESLPELAKGFDKTSGVYRMAKKMLS